MIRLPQFLLYIIVGGWNTVFGIGLYWLTYHIWGREVNYLVLAVPVNVLAITNAFVCYKLIVFRTKGHWLAEYVKCYLVYGLGCLISMVLLWILVEAFSMDPVVANVIGNVIVIIGSYFGHKYFSFRMDVRQLRGILL